MKALIDTCVIIDALQSREPFCADAQSLILKISNQSLEGFLTAKSLADIHYITKRNIKSEVETRKILSKLLQLFALLDTSAMDCRMAIPSATSDFEDAIMIETAVRSGMDCIVTRNQRDYKHSPVPVYTPAEALAKTKPDSLEE